MSDPNLKGKRKQVNASEMTPETPKQRVILAESSSPNLKSKNAIESAPVTPEQHRLWDKSSVSGFKSQRSKPNLRKAGSTYFSNYSKSPRSPLNAPRVPELPRPKSNWTLRGTDKKENVPRFMSPEQARNIRPVRYNPPPKIEEFKLPTIIGCTPTRSRFPELEPKQETRSERVLKVIRDPKAKMVKKYKRVMRQLSRMEMLKEVHKCIGALKHGSAKQIEYKPLYRLRAIKRASMLLTAPGSQKPLSIGQIDSMLQENTRRFSVGSTMSRRMSVSSHTAEGTACGPENDQKSEGQEGSAIVNEEEDEDCTVRESILLFREWLDLLQGIADPFAEDEDSTPSRQPSPSLPLTQDTLRSFQHISPTDENRSQSSSPTSSEVTITPANAHIFLKMSSSSRPASHDPFVDSADAKRTKTGDGNNASSSSTVVKHSSVKAGESSATEKSEPRTLKAVSYRGNESDIKKDTKVRPSSRIPRGPASMQAQMPLSSEQKEARVTPEPRSSIPLALATRTHGAEQMGSASNAPAGSFSGGIRVVEKPRGPRPRIAEQADPMEGSAGKIEMPERMSSSSGSSSTSVAGPERELQKPPTVFTGEYRTRTLARSGSRLEGPRLKIASSAEILLMGATTKGGDDADIQLAHSAPEHPISLGCLQKENEDDDATPRAVPSTLISRIQSAEQTPVTRNFCRPHNIGGSLRSNPVTPTQASEEAFSDDISTGPPSAFRFAYRSSSMQAVADFPLHPKAASTVNLTPKEATSQKRDIIQDDLAAKALSQTQASVRRFGNIRNIFKSSKGASEKARSRKQENEAPGVIIKEAVPDTTKARSKRSPKISPAQISPPMPMPMPMSMPIAEEETPSFARATASTRTRAEPPRDGRIRRANLAAMSTGSPQRRSVHRRSQVSIPQRVFTPSRTIGSAHDVAMVIRDEADAATKVADVGSCIEGLVAKARDAAAPDMREEYIRLALRLQKQLDEYKGAERAAVEAEACAAKKRAARAEAETLLFAALSGVLDQVGQ